MTALLKCAQISTTFSRLISHPVIATFIHLKWARSQWYFYLNSTIFALFLILYSTYISHLFARPEQFCENYQVELEPLLRLKIQN